MTTLEVSNLGRWGFMGGRGGESMRGQSGAMAMQQAMRGAGVGGTSGGGVGGLSLGESLDPTGEQPGGGGERAEEHLHSHGHGGGKKIGGKLGFLLQILGLDRFTKGKAAKGLAMAGKDQNPFDQGIVRVRLPFP
jgi:hypothetical protein